jgi:glycosyltransferase involved in cell wall biosynthesis
MRLKRPGEGSARKCLAGSPARAWQPAADEMEAGNAVDEVGSKPMSGAIERTPGAEPISTSRRSVLVLTNLYPVPWDETRGTFNAQQFAWLSDRADLTVAVAVPLLETSRRGFGMWRAMTNTRGRAPAVAYFVYVSLPRPLARLNAVLFLAAFALQRPRLALLRRWDCILGSWLYPDAVAASLLGRLRRIPVVPIALGTDGNVLSKMRDRRSQIRWMLERSPMLVTVSGALRDVLIRCGASAQRTVVAYTGVDRTRFTPMPSAEARATLGLPAAGRLVLFVGNLIPTKGTAELVAAALTFVREDPPWTFAFVGSGPERATIARAFADAGATDRLVFAGKVLNTQLRPWYCAADVLCLPSHREGVPNVVLEAMACGTPVVATNVGGIPEAVSDDAGILVDPHDSSALAAALRTSAVRKWDRQRIVESSSRFSWQTNSGQLAEAIEVAVASTVRTSI